MRNMRRIVIFSLVLVLAVSLFLPATVLAADDVTAQTTVNTAEMTIKTAGGVVIPPDSEGVYNNVPKDARVTIEYAFALKDDNGLEFGDPSYEEYLYEAGDFINVQLPYAVLFEEPISGWDVIAVGTTEVMGTLGIDASGQASITFTDYVETHSSIEGWFRLDGNFKDGTFTEGDPVVVDVEFSGDIIHIEFLEDPSSLEVEVDKSGVYDSATHQITWTITVTPNKIAELVEIIDTYSNNQVFVPGSFTAAGAPVLDAVLIFAPDTSTTTFTYAAGTLDSETVFTYKTSPTSTAFAAETGSNESVVFRNDVDIEVDGDHMADATATGNVNWIQKGGSVAGTTGEDIRIINWTVTVNYNDFAINEAVIQDLIPEGLELLDDTTYDVTFDGTPLTYSAIGNPGTYFFEDGTGLFTAVVGDLTARGTLSFSTRVMDDSIFIKNGTTRFTNEAILLWQGNVFGIPSDTSSVDVGRGVITKSAGSAVTYNHSANSIITWTIAINANNVPITNAVLTDEIPSELTYVADSFTINDPHDTLPDTFKGVFAEDSGVLTYTFGESRTITTQYTATYQTTITDYTPLYVNSNSVYYSNSATLTGTGILDGSVSDSGSQRFYSQVVAKSVQADYDHTTKRVAWSIEVNRNEIPMYNAVLSDTVPAGMSLIPGTFTVTPAIAAEPVGAFDYTTYPQDDLVSQDSFTYMFPDTFSDCVTITYETEVKNGVLLTQGDKDFSNTAVLSADDLSASSTAVASMTNQMVTKELYYLNGADYIEWAIVVNAQGVDLTDIEALDVLQEGLEVDLSSVELYPMTLAADGTLTRLGTPVAENLYNVTYDDATRKLKLSMPGAHTSAYQLEFITDVIVSPLTINNTVTLSGQSYTATSLVEGALIQVSETGLGGSGTQGSITIEKVDLLDVPLEGALFTLYNNVGAFVAQDITDEFGRVVFGELPIRTYVLEETSPPPGYIRSEETVRFRMNTEEPNEFFKFVNEHENPDTGRDDIPVYAAASAALMLLALVWLLVKQRQRA